jgi:hypothetical protein
VTPPRSITRLALDQARAAAPPAPGRTLRIRIGGRLTNCCPDCQTALPVSGVCRTCDTPPALNPHDRGGL